MMVFCPEHPKRDQNLKFTPLSETTSIPAPFIWDPPPPPGEKANAMRNEHLGMQKDAYFTIVFGSITSRCS